MQCVTDRSSLNWLFGVSCTVFTLSSCVLSGSDSVSREVIGVRSSNVCTSPWIVVRISGYGYGRFQMSTSSCGTVALMRMIGGGWRNFNFTDFAQTFEDAQAWNKVKFLCVTSLGQDKRCILSIVSVRKCALKGGTKFIGGLFIFPGDQIFGVLN